MGVCESESKVRQVKAGSLFPFRVDGELKKLRELELSLKTSNFVGSYLPLISISETGQLLCRQHFDVSTDVGSADVAQRRFWRRFNATSNDIQSVVVV